jgi:hypothetical protein
MKKIIVNKEGGFKIETHPRRFIGKGQIFSKDTDIQKEDINPVLKEKYKNLKTIDIIEFIARPEPTFAQLKMKKINMFRNKKQVEINEFILSLYNEQQTSNIEGKISACESAKNQTDLDKIPEN